MVSPEPKKDWWAEFGAKWGWILAIITPWLASILVAYVARVQLTDPVVAGFVAAAIIVWVAAFAYFYLRLVEPVAKMNGPGPPTNVTTYGTSLLAAFVVVQNDLLLEIDSVARPLTPEGLEAISTIVGGINVAKSMESMCPRAESLRMSYLWGLIVVIPVLVVIAWGLGFIPVSNLAIAAVPIFTAMGGYAVWLAAMPNFEFSRVPAWCSRVAGFTGPALTSYERFKVKVKELGAEHAKSFKEPLRYG